MKRRWPVVVMVLLIVGLLLAGPEVADRLHRVRETTQMKGLRISDLDTLGAAGVLLLGGFRGIAVDVLWLRIIYLHQQREYAGERALIELLLKMQPDHKAVWVFQAWNIAYNISVQFPDPTEQWKWIKDGITFLEKGIELNPESGDLLFTMGWFYRNKIAQNPYFEWALEKESGINNYEEGALWFDRARKAPEPCGTFAPRVVDSAVFQCYIARAEQILFRARLNDDLSFPRRALEHADEFIRKARFEVEGDADTQGLIERSRDEQGRTDAAFEAFPVRLDLHLAQGYINELHKTLNVGNFTDAAFTRTEKVLDMALAEMAKYRPKYWDSSNRWVLRHKYEDAWLAIPGMALQRFILEMDMGNVTGARRVLEKADLYINQAETGLKAAGIESPDLARVKREYKLRCDQFKRTQTGGE